MDPIERSSSARRRRQDARSSSGAGWTRTNRRGSREAPRLRQGYGGQGALMKVALVTRAVYPLHGYGGLERHVYDLARALAERDVEVTLITQPPSAGREWTPDAIHPSVRAAF